MKRTATSLVTIALILSASAQQSTSSSAVFQNERLKAQTLKDYPIPEGRDYGLVVSGHWVPESKDPSKGLIFPMQAKIICTRSEKTCKELSVTLAPAAGMVMIQDIDETDYEVTAWDAHGLIASYGGEAGSGKCESHVLTVGFESGAVSVSDIPTHKKGCEAFRETDSYRLVGGNYWVDTSPGNDMEKPRKQ